MTMSIGKLDGGTTESHGETRRQRLHLQHRTGNLGRLGQLVYRILNYQRRPIPIADAFRRFGGKHCRL